MPPTKVKRQLFTLSPAGHKALVVRAAIAGFAASGKGFNGENYDREKYPRIEALLRAHFERLYDDGKLDP
jgi:hypothetical protein